MLTESREAHLFTCRESCNSKPSCLWSIRLFSSVTKRYISTEQNINKPVVLERPGKQHNYFKQQVREYINAQYLHLYLSSRWALAIVTRPILNESTRIFPTRPLKEQDNVQLCMQPLWTTRVWSRAESKSETELDQHDTSLSRSSLSVKLLTLGSKNWTLKYITRLVSYPINLSFTLAVLTERFQRLAQ